MHGSNQAISLANVIPMAAPTHLAYTVMQYLTLHPQGSSTSTSIVFGGA